MEYRVKDIIRILSAKSIKAGEGSISVLLTDSRRVAFPEKSLFFAIKTKTNDGHKYIGELYKLGVRNFVVSELPTGFEQYPEANFLQVNDTVKALQRLATSHRHRFEIPVIGITGSNGKTIVKEFLYQLLHEEFNIVRSPRSYNSQIGVPLSVWQMNDKHTLGIFEAGISQPDEMEKLEPVIQPTIGIVTNLGEAHQENFLSSNQKIREKLLLFANCEVIIYNSDDLSLQNNIEAACLSHKGIAWSRTDTEAPLYIESIEKNKEDTTIRCTLLGYDRTYTIPFTDDASIMNVIHCLAIILYLKPSFLNNVEAFAHLEPVDMRLDVKEGINNCLLINDTYNSDINSLDIALDFLQSRKAGRKMKTTLILSDILQTGMPLKSLYKRVSDMVKRKKVDRIIGIGRDIRGFEQLFEMEKSFYLTTDDFLRSNELRGFNNELILLKGSRHFHFERISELLEKKVHETILEVDLDALINNFNHYRGKLEEKTKMACMVKAFGYGAGSYEIARTLQEHRCDYLAVAVADEGVALRNEGISIPIMVMNPEFSSFNMLFEYQLEPEVYNFRLLEALIHETSKRGVTSFPVHIKIDTGMHRLGFLPEDTPVLIDRLQKQSGIMVRSFFTHLAASDDDSMDEFTREQVGKFVAVTDKLNLGLDYKPMRHILNSAGIERFPDYQMDMVRLGIGLYGISSAGENGLRNVSKLRTTILQIKELEAGETVGYSRAGVLTRKSRIAILPIGYADGLDRRLSRVGGGVLVNNVFCPYVGNICMDISMVDVTDTDAKEGDEAIIFGDSLSVEKMAQQLDTIPYEILTSISPRVKRIYYRE